MSVPFVQAAFAAGEITPEMWGRVDIAKYHIAAATLRNMYVNYRGGANSRAGTEYVGRSALSGNAPPPRLITFAFSLTQSFPIEVGDQYMRFIENGSYVTETPIAITGASQTNPAVIQAVNNFFNGDSVAISDVQGMTQLNGRTFIAQNVTGTSFSLTDLDNNPIDATAYGAYTGLGFVARIYTIGTPYSILDVPALKFTQSADVMTLAHANYAVSDLKRFGATNWTLGAINFAPTISAPGGVQVIATVQPTQATSPPTLPCSYAYCITAVDPITGEESIASPVVAVTNAVDMGVTAGSNVVGWNPVLAAGYYNVYRTTPCYNTLNNSVTNALPPPAGSALGYVGTTYSTQFVDANITPDFQSAPPTHRNPFAFGAVLSVQVTNGGTNANQGNMQPPTQGFTGATITSMTGTGAVLICVVAGGSVVSVIVQDPGQGYQPGDPVVFSSVSGATATANIGPQNGTNPSVVAYFQERRFYASSINNPDTYWASQPGAFENMDTRVPVNDADAITGTPWAVQVNGIQFLQPMPGGLVAFTGAGAWQIAAAGSYASTPQAITPSNQQAQPQAAIGSSGLVPPIPINWDILYVGSDGGTVWDLMYQYFFNIYTATDISLLSSHLFEGHSIIQWAWARNPNKILWAVRDDGILLSCTFMKEQEIYGWARHDTLGQVMSVCVCTEPTPSGGSFDILYLVVRRFINNEYQYLIERMDARVWPNIEDTWCVDCGLVFSGQAPPVGLQMTGATGNITLNTSAPYFNSGLVGYIVRASGGIIQLTGYSGPQQMSGTVIKSPNILTPNDPNGTPFYANPSTWTVSGPTGAISNLWHLVGQTVTGLADGVVIPPQVVPPNATITLPFAFSRAVVGLPFTVQCQSVYGEYGQPTAQGRRKSVRAVTVRLSLSGMPTGGANQMDASSDSPISIAPVWSNLVQLNPPAGRGPPTWTSPGGQAVTGLYTGDVRAPLIGPWDSRGQVCVQQSLPMPLNITAFVPEVLPGDMPEDVLSPRGQQDQGGGRGPQLPQNAAGRLGSMTGLEDPRQRIARGPGPWMLTDEAA